MLPETKILKTKIISNCYSNNTVTTKCKLFLINTVFLKENYQIDFLKLFLNSNLK